MKEWKSRLRDMLEPILSKADPRPDLSAYRDMPLCIFLYEPGAEFELRHELALLKTRLEQKGKRIIQVSLMECMMEALAMAGVSPESLVENELAQLSWATGVHDYEIASKLTEQFPSLVIETPSSTGIDLSSRFFNGSQLW